MSSVAVVVVVSFIVLGNEVVRRCARVSRQWRVQSLTLHSVVFVIVPVIVYSLQSGTPCVPATPVQLIADSTCSLAVPGGKRALLHNSQANAEISKIGPRSKGEVLEMAPTLGKWQQCTRGRKCVTSCKHTLKRGIIKKSEINVGSVTCDDSCYSINESSF